MVNELSPRACGIAKNLMDDIDLVLNGHLLPAQMILSPTEVSLVMVKTTAALSRAALLYCLQTKASDTTPTAMSNLFQTSLEGWLQDAREQAIDRFNRLSTIGAQAG